VFAVDFEGFAQITPLVAGRIGRMHAYPATSPNPANDRQ
jgi:hypothetical protein